jgi:hypothetical protein
MTRYVGMCSWDEVPHLSQAQKDELWSSIPAHQRDARSRGIPVLGSGRVFPVAEEDITCEPFPIPKHWPRIGALDFGWDHPTAAVDIAWDRDNDIVYIVRTHRMREATPLMHAAVLRPWGANLPWAWPHDGLQHDKGSGEQLAHLYRKQGMKMLMERAQYENERGSGVEAGLADMLERMQTGRLKVFAGLSDWFEEFRLYHRADGRVVKLRDDLMSATRYGLMSLRFARTDEPVKPKEKKQSPLNMGAAGWMGA